MMSHLLSNNTAYGSFPSFFRFYRRAVLNRKSEKRKERDRIMPAKRIERYSSQVRQRNNLTKKVGVIYFSFFRIYGESWPYIS